MLQEKIRKEVSLDRTIIEIPKTKVRQDGRNLKNYLEKVLIEKTADDFQITENYKTVMDEALRINTSGELNFISEEEFRNKIQRK